MKPREQATPDPIAAKARRVAALSDRPVRDWHAERYAAGEALASATGKALVELHSAAFMLGGAHLRPLVDQLEAALNEYHRTKDAP